MRLSKSFVSDYVDITGIDYKDLAEKMVFAGNEYESITCISPATGLVVGNILECKKHPDSDKLSICKVDIGTTEPVQILCGAPNVIDAKKVIVAKVGAILPAGIIKEASLAGMTSMGMICSLDEIGLDSKYVTDIDKDGIHKLPNDAPVGMDAIAYLGYDDEIIDFELTANRADLLSVIGMAYEIGAIYNKQVKEPVITCLENKEDINDLMHLDVKTDNCSIYLGKIVKDIVIKESPDFIKTRLMASGIRPINNVVDISNYVMLEYGQPLHFFDKDKLGDEVVVRMALDNETITTLDNEKRVLSSKDIVIANNKEAVCLAGVMGGLNTDVTENTKNIFIESAIFSAINVRYTSKNILRSEASNRYEKGVDVNRTLKAISRACSLLNEYASGTIVGGILKHDTANHDDKIIDITLTKINKVLGLSLTMDDVESILQRLGFKTNVTNDNIKVIVPTRRMDVNIKEDIIEEVGRIKGYSHVVGHMPSSSIKKGGYGYKDYILKELRNRLSAMGLNQVITYSLVSKEESKAFCNTVREQVVLSSPMSEDRKYMKESLIPSLLNVYNYNIARNNKDVCIYETGSVYYKELDDYKEDTYVSGLISGTYIANNFKNTKVVVDFYLVKGIVENLLDFVGLKGRYKFDSTIELKDMHPGRSAAIIVDRTVVGFLGAVHPNKTKGEVYVFGIDLMKLMSVKIRGIKFKEINKYPSVKRDLAFIVKKGTTSEEITSVIKKAASRLLTNITVFDVYEIDNESISMAYSLEFEDITHTLSEKEVTDVFNRVINAVITKLDAQLRDK